MIKFKYIIGANIELEVEAKYIPGINATSTDPEVDAEIEILRVISGGLEIETDEIYIMNREGCPISLDILIEEVAWDHNSVEKNHD